MVYLVYKIWANIPMMLINFQATKNFSSQGGYKKWEKDQKRINSNFISYCLLSLH